MVLSYIAYMIHVQFVDNYTCDLIFRGRLEQINEGGHDHLTGKTHYVVSGGFRFTYIQKRHALISVSIVNTETFTGKCMLLCRLPALAEATYRDHYPSSCIVVGVTKNFLSHFFSGTIQASFLIFGTEHQYGELYRVTQF